jgi:hypothetical protein
MNRELVVVYLGDEIVVTRPGTAFSARYYKQEGFPNLLLSTAAAHPNAKAGTIFQFQAAAFEAALGKARELQWIV